MQVILAGDTFEESRKERLDIESSVNKGVKDEAVEFMKKSVDLVLQDLDDGKIELPELGISRGKQFLLRNNSLNVKFLVTPLLDTNTF